MGRNRKPATHCKYGHEFTEDNTLFDYRGYRRCRECQKRQNRKWRAAQTTGRPRGRPVIDRAARRRAVAWVDIEALWQLITHPDVKQRWRDRRNCQPEQTHWFFTQRTPEGARLRKKAKELCEGCPVRLECLAANIHDQWAYVGGTSANDRKTVRALMYEQTREEVA